MSDVDENLNLERLRDDLRAREHDVPPAIAEQLAAARREAVTLAGAREQKPWLNWFNWRGLTAAGALASIAFAVAVVLQAPTNTLPLADEYELAAAQEAELLEDLEFVAWMVALEDEDLPTSG